MRLRREKFDNRRPVDITDSQSDFADKRADELKLSFMAYIRKLIDDDMKQLSQQKDGLNTAKPVTNQAQPYGLYTADQVAQLINAIGRK